MVRRLFDVALHCSFNGTVAVIVFFVISGFAICYPFRHGEKPNWAEYFGRRYVRIGVPMLTVIALLHFAGPEAWATEQSVMWSLYAEIIYYTLYPLLRAARWRFDWTPLLALSSLSALLLALHDPQGARFHEYGIQLNWVIGLASWLIGCVLAEQSDALTAARVPRIWLWRLGVWAASTVFLIVRFHTSVGDSWMVMPFAVLIFFWRRQEIRRGRLRRFPFWSGRGRGATRSTWYTCPCSGWSSPCTRRSTTRRLCGLLRSPWPCCCLTCST